MRYVHGSIEGAFKMINHYLFKEIWEILENMCEVRNKNGNKMQKLLRMKNKIKRIIVFDIAPFIDRRGKS